MDIILPLITLVAGTFFGLLTSLCIAYLQHKRDINLKIIEQYFEARGQLCDELSVLASLQIADDQKTPSLHEHIETLEKLFYKYYDFLPSEVLVAMLCLQECLRDDGNNLYKHEDNCLLLMEERDFKRFIEQISLVDNGKYAARIRLKSKDPYVRRTAAINYQARSVLAGINRYFTIQNLVVWNRYLRKSEKTGLVLYKTKKARNPFSQKRNALNKTVKEVQADPIESQMCTIMASVLGLEEMEPDDNFFEFGGHSLAAIQLVARIEEAFNIRLPIRVVFESLTPRLLAAEVENLFINMLEGQ